VETASRGYERLQIGGPSPEENRPGHGKSWKGKKMLSPELYGLLLTAAVLAIVVCILALERFKMKAKLQTREMVKICPAPPSSRQHKKRRVTGDMTRPQ